MRLKGIEHLHGTDEQAIAITSMVLREDIMWCGLTAGRHCLIPFDTKTKTFGKAVDIFPWVKYRPQVVLSKIHNALGLLEDGRLVIGEGILYTWDGLPFSFEDDPNLVHMQKRRVQSGLTPLPLNRVGPTDVSKYDMRCMSGGKLLIYDVDSGRVDEVGQIRSFNYVQSMIVDASTDMAYGNTLIDCHFFSANLRTGTVEDHGRISTFAFHNMVVAPDGIVYAAWIDMDLEEKLRVLRFNPAKGYLERMKAVYLGDPGPKVQGNRGVDQWVVHSNGNIYFGLAGTGIFYQFDEKNLTIKEIGLAGPGGRITSIIEDEQGRLIFSGGFPIMQVGRYDPSSNKLEHFGPITDLYDRIYFHASCYKDGSLYLGETDSGVASLWEVRIPV